MNKSYLCIIRNPIKRISRINLIDQVTNTSLDGVARRESDWKKINRRFGESQWTKMHWLVKNKLITPIF